MRIFKYPLEVTDFQTIAMPAGAIILSVQEQNGQLCLWAAVSDVSTRVENRGIVIIGTGHQFNCSRENFRSKYIGTVQQHGGALVWHVFDAG